ncbi:hypothetical protein GCM10028784_38730 [Myceligenerans cantabricum]
MSPLAWFALIVVGPVAMGLAATTQCGAPNRKKARNGEVLRCRRTAVGVMQRCHDHRQNREGVAPSDWFGFASFAVAIPAFFAWRAAYDGPFLSELLPGVL